MPGHISAVLNSIANVQEKRKLELRLASHVSLGRLVMPMGLANESIEFLARTGKAPFLFKDLDDYTLNAPVEIAVFCVADLEKGPKVTLTKEVLKDPAFKARMDRRQDAIRRTYAIVQDLQTLGVHTELYEHSPKTLQNVTQMLVYVPVIRPAFSQTLDADGNLKDTDIKSSQTNVDQLGLFMAYLIKEGLVDPEQDHYQIIEAVGARGCTSRKPDICRNLRATTPLPLHPKSLSLSIILWDRKACTLEHVVSLPYLYA